MKKCKNNSEHEWNKYGHGYKCLRCDFYSGFDDIKLNFQIKKKYSGDESRIFWDMVNSIKNESDRQELYSLGVILQNLEDYLYNRYLLILGTKDR